MQVTTTVKKYPKNKRLMFKSLQELPTNYSVIAISKMTKVRATQLMAIRKKFKDNIKILVVKNKVAKRAFEKINSVPALDNLSKELEGQCALMFTNISPFQLNLNFDKNKVFLPAKGGDIVSNEIIIPAGNTGLTPGPVLSEFKESNIPTKIDQGSIWVNKDTLVAKPGDIIPQKLASLMSKLNIKPIEAGMSVNFAIADGLVFKDTDLKIDLEEFKNNFTKMFNEALSLATEIGYVTRETIIPILVKAEQGAKSVVLESAYLTKETSGLLLSKAESEARALSKELEKKAYISQ